MKYLALWALLLISAAAHAADNYIIYSEPLTPTYIVPDSIGGYTIYTPGRDITPSYIVPDAWGERFTIQSPGTEPIYIERGLDFSPLAPLTDYGDR